MKIILKGSELNKQKARWILDHKYPKEKKILETDYDAWHMKFNSGITRLFNFERGVLIPEDKSLWFDEWCYTFEVNADEIEELLSL